MGVLQRFERRLEGLVEGTFARIFGGFVQPVEVASALQREAQHKKAILAQGRVLVPNDCVVELGDTDAERLQEYDAPLRRELASMVQEHASEQGWSFVGPVTVRFETVEDLDTGVFRIRSAAVADGEGTRSAAPEPGSRSAAPDPGSRPAPYLVLTTGGQAPVGTPEAGGTERVVPLSGAVTVLGRGSEADVRLHDTGVSRLHAEIRVDGAEAVLVDLRSTNGTTVNGRKVATAPLSDGDRLGLGSTALVFRQDR